MVSDENPMVERRKRLDDGSVMQAFSGVFVWDIWDGPMRFGTRRFDVRPKSQSMGHGTC
jgi:hypothetical protein